MWDPELGKEVTDVFFVTCLDVMGSIPKWMMNKAAATLPKWWF